MWVVSFVFVGLEEVLNAIVERAEAGVQVRVLLDHHVDAFKEVSGDLFNRGLGDSVWLWADEHRDLDGGRVASLHAKCAIADGHSAFISSANLTNKAMQENLEVGLLVTGGPTPMTLKRNFDQLSQDGMLTNERPAGQ